MNKETILEAIMQEEYIDAHTIVQRHISPEKLAAFLAEHLEEKVVDETV